MKQRTKRATLAAAALCALLASGTANADVKAGVDAWSRGDYAAAVREWEGSAAAGDPDAMFNLAQAYRLGRGVPADPERAELLYARAAADGHLRAADTYGLMLFQNGDIVPKDWVRAYALLTLANSQGLPQAVPALVQMDQHIPLAQRQQAAGLAVELQRQADSTRGRELAAADLEMGQSAAAGEPTPMQTPAVAASSADAPRPTATAAAPPSVAAARSAVAEARRATGTESPAGAGASHARPTPAQPQVAAATPAPQAQRSVPPAAEAANGPWRVQLGAFSVPGNAERLWAKLSGRSELAGRTRLMVPAGRVTKLQAGGYANRGAAQAACRSLKRDGQECLVTR